MSAIGTPAFWAAIAALAASLGWEIDDRLIEHILGAIGSTAAVISIVAAFFRRSDQAP